MQIIATWTNSEWLWGFENESISDVGWKDVYTRMKGDARLKDLLMNRTMTIPKENADELADWIAHITGYESMYPAVLGSTIAFLAITFESHHGRAVNKDSIWCLVCGHTHLTTNQLIHRGPDGRGLCTKCFENPKQIFEDNLASKPTFLEDSKELEPPDSSLADVVCMFCETRRPRLMLPHTALCWVCIDRIRSENPETAEWFP